MNGIIRFYNRNRIEIIVGIIIVAFIFLVIRIFNSFYEKENESILNNLHQAPTNISVETLNEVKKQESTAVMTQQQVDATTTTNNVDIIKTFVDKCNQGEIEEAYQMLSPDMHNLFYTDIQKFKQNYVDIIFTTLRMPEIEAWYVSKSAYTYKVTLYENILATGNVKNDSAFEEFYAIIDEQGEKKINLNKFIESEAIAKISENEIVKVEVKNAYKFKDNEQYELTIRNITDKKIAIDTLENVDTIYITGENNVQYEAFSNELGKNLLVLEPYATGTYMIKFNKLYNPSVESKMITFSDIVLNYDGWMTGEEKSVKSISINL